MFIIKIINFNELAATARVRRRQCWHRSALGQPAAQFGSHRHPGVHQTTFDAGHVRTCPVNRRRVQLELARGDVGNCRHAADWPRPEFSEIGQPANVHNAVFDPHENKKTVRKGVENACTHVCNLLERTITLTIQPGLSI